MIKKLTYLLCGLLLLALTGCVKTQAAAPASLPRNIPENASVNAAWGGDMCEANGFVYYTAGGSGKILRMKPDESDAEPVTTGEHYGIHDLSADGAYLYFATSAAEDDPDTICRLPLSGGQEQKIARGNVYALQNANGRLYWEDMDQASGGIKLQSVNSDGSDLRTLYTGTIPSDGMVNFEFVVGGESVYYATGAPDKDTYSTHCDIYRMDPDGTDAVKLNAKPLDTVDMLFYDMGKLYFLAEPLDDTSSADPFYESLETLDGKGAAVTLVPRVGYFPQDFNTIEFCGISNNMFYYFMISSADSSSDHIYMDLHSVDLAKKRDTVLLRRVEMGDPAVGTVCSLRGKRFQNDSVGGMYILGNDVYFATWSMP